ncbi:hypothetical protein NEOLEDRAFT_1169804 [Neolentinus lepideus HHB14362 ss-1]|uniref:F-box domain-containing protein n=1 Tax=Neolentinus lepideus HHB14362 ss-1 TaxID=1314782 RepID=A0A165SFH8_9AGAM|nr:hypothetical protein NEOLEDRAFT_1169804 [Neolentinus lepideus HHB14362 ss-1]
MTWLRENGPKYLPAVAIMFSCDCDFRAMRIQPLVNQTRVDCRKRIIGRTDRERTSLMSGVPPNAHASALEPLADGNGISRNADSDGISSINRLPPELLAVILSFVAEDEKDVVFCDTTKVSHVCRYWRDAALGESTLWRTLRYTPPFWTSLLLERSRAAPLRASFVLDSADALESAHQVMQHFHRVAELSLTGMSNEIDEVLGELPEAASFLESWDMTKKLNHELPPPATRFFHVRAPRLRHFTLRGFACDWTSSLFRGLTSLSVHNAMRNTKTSPETVLRILSMSPKLTELALRGIFDENEVHEIRDPSLNKVELPLLSSLFVGEAHRASGINQMIMLEHLSFSATAAIVVYCRASSVRDFSRLFGFLGSVMGKHNAITTRSVGLTLSGHAIMFEGLRSTQGERSHLYLSLQCAQPRGSLELARALCQMLPLTDVERLHIPGFILGEAKKPTWSQLLGYFPGVQILEMGFLPRAIAMVLGEVSSDGNDPVVLPGLQTLVIDSGEHSFKDDMVLDLLLGSLLTRVQVHFPLSRLEIHDFVPSVDPRLDRLQSLVSRLVIARICQYYETALYAHPDDYSHTTSLRCISVTTLHGLQPSFSMANASAGGGIHAI